ERTEQAAPDRYRLFDQPVERGVHLRLDLLDDPADGRAGVTEAEPLHEEADQSRYAAGERALNPLGGIVDLAGGDVADRTHHRVDEREDLVDLLHNEGQRLVDGLQRLDDGAGRIRQLDQLLEADLDQVGGDPAGQAADHHAPQVADLGLD